MNSKKLNLKQKRILVLSILGFTTFLSFFLALFVGNGSLSIKECFEGLFGMGSKVANVVIQNIRLPRVIAGLLAGIALSIAGLIMQTMSNNVMASPSTLGVSNAAVLGANIAIVILGGGVIFSHGGTIIKDNPYLISTFAFGFALLSTLLVLGLSRIKKYNNATTVLIGVTFGTFCTGLTTLVQYFATDTTLSAAVYWSFGDLGRANYTDDLIIFIVTIVALIFFITFSYRYDAMLLGDETSSTLGININLFRFISLLLASLLTAVCVSTFGIIGFVGLVVPQVTRKLVGNKHIVLIGASSMMGATVLLISDVLCRVILPGYSLPVGAITSIVGAPIFITLLLVGRRNK